jgi:hypothetical protein
VSAASPTQQTEKIMAIWNEPSQVAKMIAGSPAAIAPAYDSRDPRFSVLATTND